MNGLTSGELPRHEPTVSNVLLMVLLYSFNWFIKSRTPEELKRRCAQLLTCLHKDVDAKPEGKAPAAKVRL